MAGERSYVRVPPDSTGKKIRHEPFHRVGYSGLTSGHIWQLGQEYIVGGVPGIVFNGPSTSSGYIGFRYVGTYDYQNADVVIGSEITREGVVVATVTSDEIIHIPYTHISGGHSPQNTVDVDATGSMNVRFAEGLPQLDAFGKLRVSSGTTLGDYIFSNNLLPADFSVKRIGNGTVFHNQSRRCAVLKVPGQQVPGVNTPDGIDAAVMASNTHHHYFPGMGQTFIATVALSAPVMGCQRSWGYFGDTNGYMFRCTGTSDGVGLVVRSDTEHAPGTGYDELIIFRDSTKKYTVDENNVATLVSTSNEGWNNDKVDGTGPSQMDLKVTDDNIYWIDVQWLGAGRIRFGTYYKGQRVTIHEYYHNANGGRPHSATGSHPAKFQIVNTNTQFAADSTISVWCVTVQTDHQVDMSKIGRNRIATMTKSFDPASIENGQEYELVSVLSPVKTVADSPNVNRTLYLPNYMEAMAYHANGDEALVEIEVYIDALVGGGNKSFSINQDEISDSSSAWMVPNDMDPANAVEVYQPRHHVLADRPKLWGGGLHVLATYIRGNGRSDVSGLYSNFQDGAFKNYEEEGGTIIHDLSVMGMGGLTPSPDGTTPTVYTSHIGMHMHREGYPVKFYGITSSIGTDPTNGLNYDVSGKAYYIRYTGIDTCELYEDMEFTIPVITNGLTYNGSGAMRGDYGLQMYFVVVCKPLAPTIAKAATLNASQAGSGNITVHFNMGWSEISQ